MASNPYGIKNPYGPGGGYYGIRNPYEAPDPYGIRGVSPDAEFRKRHSRREWGGAEPLAGSEDILPMAWYLDQLGDA